MESPSLLLPRYTLTPTRFSIRTSYPLPSPLLPRYSVCVRTPPRQIRLFASSSGGSGATSDGEGDGEASKARSETDLRAVRRKVLEAYRNSNNDLRTFLQNLVDAGVVDESEMWKLGVLWKLPAVAAFSFAGVPALLEYLGDAAGARVPAWMPLVYSLTSFLLGSLLVMDASMSDEEWEEWSRREELEGELAFLDSEAVQRRMRRRMPAAALAASAAGEAVLRAAAAVTGLDLDPPIWVAFLLFGVFQGVPYGVFSASFDPEVEGSFLGWEEFVRNIRDVVLPPRDGPGRGKPKK